MNQNDKNIYSHCIGKNLRIEEPLSLIVGGDY